jgi:hypothetical protein
MEDVEEWLKADRGLDFKRLREKQPRKFLIICKIKIRGWCNYRKPSEIHWISTAKHELIYQLH